MSRSLSYLHPRHREHSVIIATAANWLTRLEGCDCPDLLCEFERWMYDDARHRAAFIRLRVAWTRVDRLRGLKPLSGVIDQDLRSLSAEFQGRREYLQTRKSRERTSVPDAKGDCRLQKKVIVPPGTRLAAVAEFLLTRRSYERYVKPVIADMQDEYIGCIANGHERRARWVVLRGYFLVLPGWVYALLAGAARRIFTS